MAVTASLVPLKLRDSAVVEARLANFGTSVGAPVAISASSKEMSHRSIGGTIRWLGGLRFTGWFAADKAEPTGNIIVDGILVIETRASRWSHVGTSEGDAHAVRAFDFHLPEKFADGKAHRLVVVDDAGEDIGGGPVAFIAYADGLREAMAGLGLSEQEELRAQLLDRLLPMSVPFSDYRRCKERFPISYGPPVLISGGVIMVGSGAIENTLVSLNEQTHDQWVAASLPRTQDRWAGLPSSHENFYRARPRLVILSSSRSAERCSNHPHCTGSPMPLSIFRRPTGLCRRRSERARMARFGRLPFQLSITNGCSSKDIALICSRCVTVLLSELLLRAPQISIACLIFFWMTK